MDTRSLDTATIARPLSCPSPCPEMLPLVLALARIKAVCNSLPKVYLKLLFYIVPYWSYIEV
jgi:hypothetical protein